MIKFQGAVIKEQSTTFAVVIVKPSVLQLSSEAQNASRSFSRYFPGVPIILMAQDSRGTPTYLGRKDIVNFLANTHVSRIPWQEYTFN